MSSFAPETRVSRGLRPNFLILNKGAISSTSLFKPFCSDFKSSRAGFCRNPRGIFPNKFPGEFCGGIFGRFLGPLCLEKTGGKNPQQFPNQNLGASQPKSTLQECGLDK